MAAPKKAAPAAKAKPATKAVAKPAAKPVAKAVAAPAKKSAPAVEFPKTELTAWLKTHKSWNHDQWVALLTDLKKKGYGAIADSQQGRESIGLFLESNRK